MRGRAVVAAILIAAACADPDVHGDAGPAFAGLQSAVASKPGSALLTWTAASGSSNPITYEVYAGNAAGEENFRIPLARTTGTQVEVSGLPGGALPTFFV